MLKTISTALLIVLLALPCEAGRPRKRAAKAGKVENNVYTDAQYGFSFELPKGWWTKVQKDEEPCRLILEKKKFDVSTEMSRYRDDFGPPTAKIWCINSPLTASVLIDSLLSPTYSSELKDDLLYYLNEPGGRLEVDEYKTTDRSVIKIDTTLARVWQGIVTYTFANIIVDGVKLAGGIIAIDQGEETLVIIAQGYSKSFDQSFGQIKHMVRSLKKE